MLPVVKLLRAMGIDIWMDVDDLRAGESWPKTIHKALEDSIGLIVFVSRAAMRSEWVRQEIIAASAHADRLIIPVMLEDVPDLPPSLAERQWLDFRDLYDTSRIELSVQQIADATQAHLHSNRDVPPLSRTETPKIAAAMAKEVRTVVAADTGKNQPPDSIFVVHGHDNRALSELENYLTDVSIKPFILSRMGGAAQSLLQKFFKSAADARFAIVILSGDDFGAS
ncbi:MAG: TIR domain-containing protein, partial [Planctomycetes bacterium]|nr:TIR domain-containing protein [Planctomycetota bacterium]